MVASFVGNIYDVSSSLAISVKKALNMVYWKKNLLVTRDEGCFLKDISTVSETIQLRNGNGVCTISLWTFSWVVMEGAFEKLCLSFLYYSFTHRKSFILEMAIVLRNQPRLKIPLESSSARQYTVEKATYTKDCGVCAGRLSMDPTVLDLT